MFLLTGIHRRKFHERACEGVIRVSHGRRLLVLDQLDLALPGESRVALSYLGICQ